MDRAAATLSGGEAQRIRLATQIGSSLVGVLYILDEPSIGLHQRDNSKLIATLERLRDLGNTVIVVEHDEQTMRAADHLVDLGPGAGEHGGRIVAQGTATQVERVKESLTGQFLAGTRTIEAPDEAAHAERLRGDPRREPAQPARHRRAGSARRADVRDRRLGLGQVDARQRGAVQGVANRLHRARQRPGAHRAIHGLDQLDKIIAVDQSPIGRTPRSNPATYTGLFDVIRDLFSKTQEARARGYKPGRFCFNVKGGRCEVCKGDGQIKIEMHFLPDVYVPCEQCHGKRYNRETLEVRFKGKNIADVLDMPVEEALGFFEHIPKVRRRLETLNAVGLGYVRLGQPATTLSGGEAQRVKLATELSKIATGSTLYILDEPTTGLHFADVQRLLEVLQRLVDAGNSVVVIEHNLDVIKCADRLIDMGPEGGEEGGMVIAAGTPEEVAAEPASHTGRVPRRAAASRGAKRGAARTKRRAGKGTRRQARSPARRSPLERRDGERRRAQARLWAQKWRWYERNSLPWNRARIHWELMRREAFVRWPVHGNVLEALREGRLEIGAGALLEPGVWITAPGSARVRIGAGTFLNLGVMIAAQELVEIGEHCMLANGCFVSDASHRFDDPEQPITWQGFESKGPTRIGDNCWLGANVVVTSGVTHRRALRDRRQQRRHERHRAVLDRRRRARRRVLRKIDYDSSRVQLAPARRGRSCRCARARVAPRAHVLGVGGDARVHLLLEVGVALDEARAEAVADAEQVVEDEHLPVGGGAGADADHGDLDGGHQLLGDRARDRLEDEREAARLLQRERLLGDLRGRGRGAALRLPAAERGRGLRGEADVAHHRDAGADDRARAADRGRAAALELDRVAAGLLDHPHRGGDRLLVADLVGAERQVADQQRRAQAAAHGAREHEHVVELDRGGGVVAEHGRGGRVADEHEVDAGRLGGAGARVVVGGDHHDRFAEPLLLGEQRQRHRQAAGVGWGVGLDVGVAGHGVIPL